MCFRMFPVCKNGRARRGIFSIQHTNSSVLFLREENIIVTRGAWYFTAEFKVSLYEEAIAIVRCDLMLMHKQSKEFTFVTELKQIEVLLNSLESKLHYFYQLLPKPEYRRGMINMGTLGFESPLWNRNNGRYPHPPSA